MWFLGAGSGLVIALLLLRHYAEPETRLYIKALVAFSWMLGFFHFLVLPFDIEHAFCRRCLEGSAELGRDPDSCRCLPAPGIEVLPDLIFWAYGITMLLGYVMNDLVMGYINSGEFSRRGRLRDSLRDASASLRTVRRGDFTHFLSEAGGRAKKGEKASGAP